MREVYEFRIAERFAHLLFADTEGKRLGDSVRKIQMSAEDPRFPKIGELQRRITLQEKRSFFYGWRITHRYSAHELESAKAFRLIVSCVFEPAGEQCGTQYDEQSGCSRCGTGAKQQGPLFLNIRTIPKQRDFATTIADEIVVSNRAKELLQRNGTEGVAFHPVRFKGATSLELTNWFQFVPKQFEADIAAPTRIGNDPFDDDPQNEYRCGSHLMGLNLLSEVSARLNNRNGFGVTATRQFVGIRRGVLRPRSIILISPEVRRLIVSAKLTGCRFEIAQLVEPKIS
jgi:hypothetical protein